MPRSNQIPTEIFSLPPVPFCLPFSIPGKNPVRSQISLQSGHLEKIRENYGNNTASAESSETLRPKRGEVGVRRKRNDGGGEKKESRALEISLGNLWIIPQVLMKVVRIKNAIVH